MFSGAAAKKEENRSRFNRLKGAFLLPMPSGDPWLSLKVSDKVTIGDRVLKPGLFVSVPKKIVPLATKRNRLKRLIREAVRADDYFKKHDKVYYFRIREWPGEIRLSDVKKMIARLQ